jgi:integrase
LKEWLNRVNLPYHSPHKFRHGHAVYALKKAKDISTLKAVYQNLMHANLSVTDGVYGILSDNDVRGQISSIGNKINILESKEYKELIPLLEQFLSVIKGNKSS